MLMRLFGRLAFAFSPHSSRVVVDRDAVQLVPDGISAEDAVFFPSVETVLSLVHDANVRVGENVAVYGQGEKSSITKSIASICVLPSKFDFTACLFRADWIAGHSCLIDAITVDDFVI